MYGKSNNIQLGLIRELKARNYLIKRNFTIIDVTKNMKDLYDYKYKVDIIAFKEDCIYFFQVKNGSLSLFDSVFKRTLLDHMQKILLLSEFSNFADFKFALITVPYPKKQPIHMHYLM